MSNPSVIGLDNAMLNVWITNVKTSADLRSRWYNKIYALAFKFKLNCFVQSYHHLFFVVVFFGFCLFVFCLDLNVHSVHTTRHCIQLSTIRAITIVTPAEYKCLPIRPLVSTPSVTKALAVWFSRLNYTLSSLGIITFEKIQLLHFSTSWIKSIRYFRALYQKNSASFLRPIYDIYSVWCEYKYASLLECLSD